MAFDGIVTNAVAAELSSKLLLGKIEKVYQPEQDELVFLIHTRTGNYRLYASANSSHSRIHLIEESLPNPPAPSAFCMLLRKHLQGGRIVDISQIGADRMIEISIETTNELGFSVNKKLIFEIMGKHSNIILIDANTEKIIDSIKRISIDVNRARQILPGKIYQLPPAQDKIPFSQITREQMAAFCSAGPDLLPKEILNGVQGVSPALAQTLADSADAFNRLEEIRTALSRGISAPVVYVKADNSPVDFHMTPLDAYAESYEAKAFESVSQAIDYYFQNKSSSNRIKQKSSDLDRAVKNHLNKLYLKKQRLNEDLLKAENSDRYRLFGELLTANLHLISPGDKTVTVTNYYDNSPVSISLDPRHTPSKNAQQYFKRYAKSRTAVKEKQIQLDETDNDIAYLESVASFIDRAATIEEVDSLRMELIEAGFLKKRKTTEKQKKGKAAPFQYTISDGFRFLVGRNNKENDYLTFKLAGNKDIWLHTKDIPGSHGIIFTEGRELTEAAIFDAAALAAYHSKGRASDNVPVDYTQVRYVKKPAGAKPGMVIFTHNKTVYVTPRAPESIESSS